MNLNYYKSWKFALVVAAGITLISTGYKYAGGLGDTAAFAENAEVAAFSGGKPSDELLSKPLVEGITQLSLGATLAAFERYLTIKNHQVSWEPENAQSFIMRTSRVDPLTKAVHDIAMQMRVYEPSQISNHDPVLSSGAIAITAVAINGQLLDPRVAQNTLFQLQTDMELMRGSGEL